MDWYTKNALSMYWIRGDDEEVLTEKELFNLEETQVNEDDEVAEIFRIETNIFDFKTPLCKEFNEFNYLLKIDTDLLTHDISRFKTYNEYKKAWIYKRDKTCHGHAGKSNEEAIKDEREPMDHYGIDDSNDHLCDVMIKLPPCTREAAKHFEKYNQLIYLMQIFMGLDESYLAIRSNILTKEHLPLVKVVFVVVSGEESHMNATTVGATKPTAIAFAAKTFDNKRRFNDNNNFNKGSSSNSNSNNTCPNPNLKCTNCNKIGHIVDKYFELVGYPASYVKRNFNANTRTVSSNNDFASAALSSDYHNDDVSGATSKDENTHHEGNVFDETDLVDNFFENTELNSKSIDLPINTVRRSSRQTKLRASLNDFIVNGKIKYGVERVVNYANLNADNFYFAEPSCYDDAILDNNWTDAMNTEIEALNKNHTWIITDLQLNSKSTDLPVNIVRRSSIQTKLCASLNDFIVNGKIKYGVQRVVNYANLNADNFYFAEPSCYDDAILDNNWIDAMNAEIEALNKNYTWIITDLPANRKPIRCK
uniref:Uncharacterized protein n=1 Tax=Tanacetum cinerariifolium TaxID=118510 RepID=A0A6L2NEI5_TANCI|nr:hypothetical protein [Tanacetum cinerariifolium]